MSMFVIYKRLSKKEAQTAYNGIKEWFGNNPKRKVCHTDYFKVRRNHVKEDILEHAVAGAFIKD